MSRVEGCVPVIPVLQPGSAARRYRGWLGPLMFLAASCCAMSAHATSSFGPTGYTNKSGGAGCSAGGCHTPTKQGTATISGPTSLTIGSSTGISVSFTSLAEGSGVKMGLNVATSDPGTQLSESAANLYIDDFGELAHTQTGGALATSNASGAAGYSFTYTMPANAVVGSVHTIYAVARMGNSWNHAAELQITATAPPKADQAPLTGLFNGSANPGAINVGDAGTLSTSGGSGTGTVSYVSNNGACAISGTTLTAATAGGCTVTVTKEGDADYNPATDLLSITIDKASQAPLSVTASPASVGVGGTSTLSTSGGSGTGLVSYTSDTSHCSISGNMLTGVSIGSCMVTATKAADTNFLAATAAVVVSVGSALQDQAPLTVLFNGSANPPPANVGSSGTLSVSGGSGIGSVSFFSNGAACSISGSTLSAVAMGSCQIIATKAGDTNYNSASDTLTLSVGKANQAPLTVNASPATLLPGATSVLSATGGSGTGALSFASSNANCTISGNVLTAVALGNCTVTATKAEDATYLSSSATTEVIVGVARTITRRAYFVNPGRFTQQASLLRFINTASQANEIAIEARDDEGTLAPGLTLALGAGESTLLTAQNLEQGAPAKGLSGKLGTGIGRWQLTATSQSGFELVSLLLAENLLSNTSELAPDPGSRLWFARPVDRAPMTTLVRIVNPNPAPGTFTLIGIDDGGQAAPGGSAKIALVGRGGGLLTSADLEKGNAEKGILGGFGNGAGNWRVVISTGLPRTATALSLLRSDTGLVSNLSSVAPQLPDGRYFVAYARGATGSGAQSMLRITNQTGQSGNVVVSGIDDQGGAAPGGTVRIPIGARKSTLVSVDDLESGNSEKGYKGALGDGQGDWQLTLNAGSTSIAVMHLVRTPDGFLTSVNTLAARVQQQTQVWMFNSPAYSQVSLLRLVNRSNAAGTVEISATDDAGSPAPGGVVSVTMVARGSRLLSATDLEQGNPARGISGALGDGSGRWRLSLSSSLDIRAMSLIRSPAGHITNISAVAEE